MKNIILEMLEDCDEDELDDISDALDHVKSLSDVIKYSKTHCLDLVIKYIFDHEVN